MIFQRAGVGFRPANVHLRWFLLHCWLSAAVLGLIPNPGHCLIALLPRTHSPGKLEHPQFLLDTFQNPSWERQRLIENIHLILLLCWEGNCTFMWARYLASNSGRWMFLVRSVFLLCLAGKKKKKRLKKGLGLFCLRYWPLKIGIWKPCHPELIYLVILNWFILHPHWADPAAHHPLGQPRTSWRGQMRQLNPALFWVNLEPGSFPSLDLLHEYSGKSGN